MYSRQCLFYWNLFMPELKLYLFYFSIQFCRLLLFCLTSKRPILHGISILVIAFFQVFLFIHTLIFAKAAIKLTNKHKPSPSLGFSASVRLIVVVLCFDFVSCCDQMCDPLCWCWLQARYGRDGDCRLEEYGAVSPAPHRRGLSFPSHPADTSDRSAEKARQAQLKTPGAAPPLSQTIILPSNSTTSPPQPRNSNISYVFKPYY